MNMKQRTRRTIGAWTLIFCVRAMLFTADAFLCLTSKSRTTHPYQRYSVKTRESSNNLLRQHGGSLSTSPDTACRLKRTPGTDSNKGRVSAAETILAIPVGNLTDREWQQAMDIIWNQVNNKTKQSSADLALKLLERLLTEQRRTRNRNKTIRKGVVFNVLKACCQQAGNQETSDTLLRVLDSLKRNSDLWDAKFPSLVIRAVAKCNGGPHVPSNAYKLLRDIHHQRGDKRKQQQKTDLALPDRIAYTAVLGSYAKRGMAQEAEELLDEMIKLHQDGFLREGPNTAAYNCVMDALARAKIKIGGQGDIPKRARKLLLRMQRQEHEGDVVVENVAQPDLVTYNNLLRVFASHGMAADAELTLQQMLNLVQDGALQDGPDTESYNHVMKAWSKCTDWDAAFRAKRLLKHMQSLQEAGFDIHPTVATFNRLLSLYAKRGKSTEAERLLQEMIDLAASDKLQNGPDIVAYNCVMNALAKSREWDSPFRARTLLNHMDSLGSRGGRNVRPNLVTYTSLLSCYAVRGMANKAESTLQQMHILHKAGKLRGMPDVIAYNIVLDSLANSKTNTSPERAVGILKQMQHYKITPNNISYNSILKCYCNVGRVQEAQGFLRKEMPVKPNTVSYNILLSGLARTGTNATNNASYQQASDIFDEMKSRGIQPTLISYTSLLNCFAQHGMAHQAQDVLKLMHDLHEGGQLRDAPDTIAYNSVLNALDKSGDVDAPQRARDLWNEMQTLYRITGEKRIEPDKVTKAIYQRILDSEHQ